MHIMLGSILCYPVLSLFMKGGQIPQDCHQILENQLKDNLLTSQHAVHLRNQYNGI